MRFFKIVCNSSKNGSLEKSEAWLNPDRIIRSSMLSEIQKNTLPKKSMYRLPSNSKHPHTRESNNVTVLPIENDAFWTKKQEMKKGMNVFASELTKRPEKSSL